LGAAIHSAQSAVIDPADRLWVLDTGTDFSLSSYQFSASSNGTRHQGQRLQRRRLLDTHAFIANFTE
jgi:hypothetical protein